MQKLKREARFKSSRTPPPFLSRNLLDAVTHNVQFQILSDSPTLFALSSPGLSAASPCCFKSSRTPALFAVIVIGAPLTLCLVFQFLSDSPALFASLQEYSSWETTLVSIPLGLPRPLRQLLL